MKRMNQKKAMLLAIIACLSLSLCGCSEQNENNGNTSAVMQQNDNETSKNETIIDYGDAESFEAALNNGENLEGKIVMFTAEELRPDSALGYNVYAGEHLNFVSSRNPDIKVNDTVTVKAVTIENLMGSWIIHYEKVKNAVADENTITFSQSETAVIEETSITVTEKTDTSVEIPETECNTENSTAKETVESENTFEHNDYYDITEEGYYMDSIGYTHIIYKVLAKKDSAISSTIIAFGDDGTVIGKSTDDIILTNGEYNYFHYSFENDISKAKLQENAKSNDDYYMDGERNAVEMEQYNQSGDNLYITVKQTMDNLGSFSQFKILFYKDDKIVSAESGYFSVYAENLNGKGTSDVIELWAYGIDYDRVEYIFEP